MLPFHSNLNRSSDTEEALEPAGNSRPMKSRCAKSYVWNFGEPRADRSCPVIIITCVRIMPGPDNPVGTMPTVSIVWPVIIAKHIRMMMMMTMTNIRTIRSAKIIFGDSAPSTINASRSKPYKISSPPPNSIFEKCN